MTTKFSAGPQAQGYLYQVLCALYLLLSQRDEDAKLTIENLDDVVFETDGTPRELLQLKHHSTPTSLTDTSDDLWKTIRIWCEHLKEEKFKLPGTLLSIITTSHTRDGSIAALLRPSPPNNRNPQEASHRLYEVARQSSNKALQPAFDVFLSLSPTQRDTLVDAIQVIDATPDIEGIADSIKWLIRSGGNKPQFVDGIYERLEGWWFDTVIRHLRNKSAQPIPSLDVRLKMAVIAEQFYSESLPTEDFLEKWPDTPPDATQDTRLFVQQLRAIAVENARIEKAILDYYRAFEQRSCWLREDLLISDELERYENKLVDEWERYSLALQEDLKLEQEWEKRRRELQGELLSDEADEYALLRLGRKVYKWVESEADYRIRPRVDEAYVMRGSFHMLADQPKPRVWWHPKFVERLQTLLQTSQTEN